MSCLQVLWAEMTEGVKVWMAAGGPPPTGGAGGGGGGGPGGGAPPLERGAMGPCYRALAAMEDAAARGDQYIGQVRRGVG